MPAPATHASPTADQISSAAPPGYRPGLEGIVAARTSLGAVRGHEGFFHYGPYSGAELAKSCSLVDVWYLLREGALPTAAEARTFAAELAALRTPPPATLERLARVVTTGSFQDPMRALRTALALAADELPAPLRVSPNRATAHANALALVAQLPGLVAALHALRSGRALTQARPDLDWAANYLYMLSGREPNPAHARALEQYWILTIDHGLNASTFTARVVASTGADVEAALGAGLAALSGPLHGGAPGHVVDMLEAIGSVHRAEPWLRDAIQRGARVMGFGHRIYRTDDPRSVVLAAVAAELGGPWASLAQEIEPIAVRVLGEHRPARELRTNVEYYAGVVLDRIGIPRDLFTLTFAVSRAIGWAAHIAEQVGDNRIYRPTSEYVGPPAPQPIPSRSV